VVGIRLSRSNDDILFAQIVDAVKMRSVMATGCKGASDWSKWVNTCLYSPFMVLI